MTASLDTPKIFISYSWKPAANKQRTLELAERLSADGIHVIIDEWDLAEGQDKFFFMEQMVNNPDIKRVLLICNQDYAEKANKKKGGVGIESMIVSDDIYSKADQKKFIPVIFEKDAEGKAFVPTFINTRIYIDLSSADIFEDEYEKLLRNIFEKPSSRRPAIGTRPAYLLEDEPIFLGTAHKVKAIQNALVNEKKNFQVFIDDYYSTFIEALKDFEITDEELSQTQHIDELVLQKIEALKNLRNDFINFLEVLFTYSYDFNQDKFTLFMEKLITFITQNEAKNYPSNRFGNLRIDQYRFFYYELFLYTVAVMIEKEKYKELGLLLNEHFIVYNEKTYKTEQFLFTTFQNYVSSLDKYRNERLQLRRISISADLIKQRADHPKYSFDKIRECDALLYYVSILMIDRQQQYFWFRWFPMTTVYNIYNLPFLERLISLRFFDRVKSIFAVNTPDELKEKVAKGIELKVDRLERFHFELPYLQQAFNFEKIGTLK